MKFLISLFVISVALPSALSNALGAPTISCETLRPFHGLNQPQTGSPPFTILLSSQNVAPGGSVSILINSSIPFRGFMVQSRIETPGIFSF